MSMTATGLTSANPYWLNGIHRYATGLCRYTYRRRPSISLRLVSLTLYRHYIQLRLNPMYGKLNDILLCSALLCCLCRSLVLMTLEAVAIEYSFMHVYVYTTSGAWLQFLTQERS